MASLRSPWPQHGPLVHAASPPTRARPADSGVAATLSGGDLASEVNRLRSAARFHQQELSKLDQSAEYLARSLNRLDDTLGRLAASLIGASLPCLAAGAMLHANGLRQSGMLMLAVGATGTGIWTVTKQSMRRRGMRLEHERQAARERADNCERLAQALDPASLHNVEGELADYNEITQRTAVPRQ